MLLSMPLLQRIVSLVPSQTELLFALGLEAEVVGITKFCVHPNHWFQTKQRVGGTKNVKFDLVQSLHPDLVIANKEENVKEQVEALSAIATVHVTDIKDLSDALEMIRTIGDLTGTGSTAADIINEIETNFTSLAGFVASRTATSQRLRNTAYLIWRDPWMAAGGDTFINNMLRYCGLRNVFENQPRYPEISIQQLKETNCEILLLSSEPYPFKAKHIEELQAQLPSTQILLADGEYFSWYGSRLVNAPEYFRTLLMQIG
jgi:ABC-type Fe3+-hydroxamate transport system substrate-binding protein